VLFPKLTVGVTIAANFQPNFSNMVLPRSIITRVTVPVADEKLPMKAEYSLGFGNACCGMRSTLRQMHECVTLKKCFASAPSYLEL
jgi:hypothetical protein